MIDNGITGAEAGLSGDEQIRIALQTIADYGGVASIQQIYEAVEARLAGRHLSRQGRDSLRSFVNRDATNAGYIYKYDRSHQGWRITPEGREIINAAPPEAQEVINVDTQQIEYISNATRGDAFELYILDFFKRVHPHYVWYHEGRHKYNERGLDIIGTRVGHSEIGPETIGIQTKLYPSNATPTQIDWLKFLAGCFARRVDSAVFVTSGRLTGEQRREVAEAKVTVIEGRDEITRLARLHDLQGFSLFDT